MTSTVDPAGQVYVTARPGRRALMAPPLLLGAMAGVAAAGLAVWNPHTHHVPLCPVHAATGLWCPLCGGLRAVNDLTNHQWMAALSDNVLVVVLAPLVVWWWLSWIGRARRGLPGTAHLGLTVNGRRWIWWGGAAVVLSYTILRNLPFGAFLAPSGGG